MTGTGGREESPAGSLSPGKLPAGLLAGLLADVAPASDEVLIGPAVGEDAAAVTVPGGVLVAATDPITLTGSEIGGFAVVINANDVAVTGVRPRWFLAAVLLPPDTTADQVQALFADMRQALVRVRASLIGGHTEVTTAVSHPVVVGHMLGLAEDGRVVATGGAQPGDRLVQIGAVPVEGAAVLAAEAGDRLDGLDEGLVTAARAALDDPGIAVVEPALAAAQLGVTAMHDPTEGGLAAGLCELARAAGVAVRVDRDAVAWFAPGIAVCEAVGADPWATLASGCLLATFPPDRVEDAVTDLRTAGYPVATVGAIEAGHGVVDSTEKVVAWPDRDEVARVLSG